MATRAAMISAIKAAIADRDGVLAAWEGGSAAFGNDDDMSDVDAVVVVDALTRYQGRAATWFHALHAAPNPTT